MTNKAVFNQGIFDLPKRYVNSLPEYVNSLFNDFKNALEEFDGDLKREIENKKTLIKASTACILLALNYYYNGYPARAYQTLVKTLNKLEGEGVLPIQKGKATGNRALFYRVRVSENKTLRRNDLFHVPFEIREKVGTQRYSIPGLPCLYLGDSAFVCWEELGRPSFDVFHISRFDISSGDFRLLYFNTNTDEIRRRCFGKNVDGTMLKTLVAFLCCWPLLAACSIIVRKPEDVFKPEYIIPQLLLQWVVTTQRVDGIAYRSNRVSAGLKNAGTFTNVVLPVKKNENNGFCPELSKRIKLTNPITAQLLEIAGSGKKTELVEIDHLRRAMYIEIFEGERTIYSETKFGELEARLEKMRVSLL